MTEVGHLARMLVDTGGVSENAQLVARTKSTKASKGVQQVNSDGGS